MTQISAYDAGQFIRTALRLVHTKLVPLGLTGQIVRDALNQFGEQSLVADFFSEKVVIAEVRKLARKFRVTILVIAEEHDDLLIGPDGTDLPARSGIVPAYTVYIDGLDGSSVYKTATEAQLKFPTTSIPFNRRPRFGTMVGIAQGANPRYCDVLAAGILEPSTQRILIGTRGGSVSLSRTYQAGRGRSVHTTEKWSPSGLIYCDQTLPCNRAKFEYPLKKLYDLDTVSAGSAARYYFDVTTGLALASCEWTRKRCLEVVTGYLLVTEAGGVMVNLAGLDIGNNLISVWGSTFTEFFIAAGSDDIADYILEAVLYSMPADAF